VLSLAISDAFWRRFYEHGDNVDAILRCNAEAEEANALARSGCFVSGTSDACLKSVAQMIRARNEIMQQDPTVSRREVMFLGHKGRTRGSQTGQEEEGMFHVHWLETKHRNYVTALRWWRRSCTGIEDREDAPPDAVNATIYDYAYSDIAEDSGHVQSKTADGKSC